MSNLKINVLGQPFKVKNLGQTQKQKLWTNSKKGFQESPKKELCNIL